MPAINNISFVIRLLPLGLIVFTANGGLLILQLLAGRVLAPLIGSSLETWTAIIGVFLLGIAAGNWIGGQSRLFRTHGKNLAVLLLLGALSTIWLMALPEWLNRSSIHLSIPLGLRIIVLSIATCFPAGFVLSIFTPVAIRIVSTFVASAGRVVGAMFAIGTLGCLFGNFATNYWFIPYWNINTIIEAVAVILVLLAVASYLIPWPNELIAFQQTAVSQQATFPSLSNSYLIVFACSFAAMALELAGVRIMAQMVGISLITWSAVIGVILAGTAIGNELGGVIADRYQGSRTVLAFCLIAASTGIIMVMGTFLIGQGRLFESLSYVQRVVWTSIVLFVFPSILLGTISPQVIRIASPSIELIGTVAGHVYAVSTIGAIAGTFITGLTLISEFGAYRVIMIAAALPLLTTVIACRVWEHLKLLYLATIVAGFIVGGMILFNPANTTITRESNYFTIQVVKSKDPVLAGRGVLTLQLDLLIHSYVIPDDPTFLYYTHEQTQLEFLRDQARTAKEPHVLVIGGGGYTYPRAGKTLFPQSHFDVVEIDPAVTAVAYEKLALDPSLKIQSFHMDGRQFVSEFAKPRYYHLITMDAVNDLSVPSHLLTKEFHDQVKDKLTADGVYLVSVIDQPNIGKMIPAVYRTLKQSFPHVTLLSPKANWEPDKQNVFVLYASNHAFDSDQLLQQAQSTIHEPRLALGGGLLTNAPWCFINQPPAEEWSHWMNQSPELILSDQYAPVDWLMADVFRRRKVGEGK